MKTRKHMNPNHDEGAITNNSYNDFAGSQKVSNVGHYLKPIKNSGTTFTTNCTTRTRVESGITLAVYNNANTVASITIGDSTVLSQAPGAVQASTSFVGIALAPNAWTYLNTYEDTHIITSAATVLVYEVSDETRV